MSGLLSEIDQLYELSVTEPHRCTEQFYVDWAEGIASIPDVDKVSARYVRRCMTMARKLSGFWTERGTAAGPQDWRSRVDIALGARAWRPQLDLAEHLLERDGSSEAFDVVAGLFPVVNNQPFLDGVTYEQWQDGRA